MKDVLFLPKLSLVADTLNHIKCTYLIKKKEIKNHMIIIWINMLQNYICIFNYLYLFVTNQLVSISRSIKTDYMRSKI